MTLSQLASRSNLKRSRLCQIESSELDGQLNINTLNKIAESVGCKLVYAIIPDDDIETILSNRAQIMAEAAYEKVHQHTRNENETKEEKIKQIKESLLSRNPTHLWRETYLD
jgi:predicted DNA-binding mobile mystery protein A